MLYVERDRTPRPKAFDGPEIEKAAAAARAIFTDPARVADSSQARHPVHLGDYPCREEIQAALHDLFRGKCAYCERKLDDLEGGWELDLFRPASEAMDDAGKASSDHYWWLAYTWQNLYPACRNCVRHKRTWFPTLGKRLKYPQRQIHARDDGLLIDPCHDRPEWYLEFLRDGKMAPAMPPYKRTRDKYRGLDRGAKTIRILGLNRSELVESRRAVVKEHEQTWPGVYEILDDVSAIVEALDREALIGQPHSGLRLYLLVEDVARLMAEQRLSQRKSRPILASLKQAIPEAAVLFARRRSLDQELRAATAAGSGAAASDGPQAQAPRSKGAVRQQAREPQAALPDAALPETPPPAAPPEKTRVFGAPREAVSASLFIERVEIRNFKAIHKLDFTVPFSAVVEEKKITGEVHHLTRTGWKMLLGENGTGKSTVLEAVSLALVGAGVHQLAYLEPVDVLRRGSRSGWVRLYLSDGVAFRLRFTKTTFSHPDGCPEQLPFVRAYGATRLLPRRQARRQQGDPDQDRPRPEDRRATAVAEVSNLFDPYVSLVDANSWLASLGTRQFKAAARAIRDLLQWSGDRPPEERPAAEAGKELVTLEAGKVLVAGDPLDRLSDGYRSVVAVACDLMAGVPHDVTDMQVAGGIVLIDELGAHLHPQWKMQIVGALRATFSAMQFIASTHEPLCLRGLIKGEIALITRQGAGERRVSLRDRELPSPSDLRIDQLLTSEFFGLDATIDPTLDLQFRRYYYLLGKQMRARDEHSEAPGLTPEEEQELRQLRRRLARVGTLGSTRRDRRLYEIIDYSLVEEEMLDPTVDREREKLEKLRDTTRRRVLDIWDYVKLDESLPS